MSSERQYDYLSKIVRFYFNLKTYYSVNIIFQNLYEGWWVVYYFFLRDRRGRVNICWTFSHDLFHLFTKQLPIYIYTCRLVDYTMFYYLLRIYLIFYTLSTIACILYANYVHLPVLAYLSYNYFKYITIFYNKLTMKLPFVQHIRNYIIKQWLPQCISKFCGSFRDCAPQCLFKYYIVVRVVCLLFCLYTVYTV